ncbi:MAG: aminotransferase class I/II-fold pyridoxal phosphate-dependent enzyme, partial [Selenomonadaceae bacterium]|nr:aminotransferase class I/II-fold pyridoxal phosphate-dependent enzyme [Selenomonadaceae bacterium]
MGNLDRKQYGQDRAPIAEAMKAYAGDGALAFHTPGHQQGLGAHALLRDLITAQGLREEVSLMEELDDLHAPSGCIREAQELAAELDGADAAYFMVNGTTGAVHTMLLAALSPGDTVLVPRNAHRSMMGGILLSGARPVFLSPEIDRTWGIPMGLSVETVREAIEQHPDAKALALVSPTYYGVASDLREMAKILHEKGMLLLVDEAHGAHLKFHAGLPPQAMDAGADLAAQSTHKLLGSLTQSSMLLGRKGRVDFSRVQEAASLLQSTSPNYLLLASLDIARMQMAMEGKERIARAVRLSEGLRKAVRGLDGLKSFGQEIVGNPGVCGLDATKVTISVRGLGLT